MAGVISQIKLFNAGSGWRTLTCVFVYVYAYAIGYSYYRRGELEAYFLTRRIIKIKFNYGMKGFEWTPHRKLLTSYLVVILIGSVLIYLSSLISFLFLQPRVLPLAMHGPHKVWSPPHPSRQDLNYAKAFFLCGLSSGHIQRVAPY